MVFAGEVKAGETSLMTALLQGIRAPDRDGILVRLTPGRVAPG
jgi:hypothetical protein